MSDETEALWDEAVAARDELLRIAREHECAHLFPDKQSLENMKWAIENQTTGDTQECLKEQFDVVENRMTAWLSAVAGETAAELHE